MVARFRTISTSLSLLPAALLEWEAPLPVSAA